MQKKGNAAMLTVTVLSAEKKVGEYAICRAGAIVGLLVVLCFAAPVGGAQTTANWIDTTGFWNNAANWDVGIVPNNGNGTFYDVVIHGTDHDRITFANTSPTTIDSLTLGTGETLSSADNQQLTIGSANAAGTLTNNGTIYWEESTLTMGAGAQITNNGTLSWVESNLTIGAGGGGARVTNNGTLTAGIYGWAAITGAMFNNNVVMVTGSALTVTSDYNQGSAASTIVISNGTLSVGGNFNNGPYSGLSVTSGSSANVGGDFNNGDHASVSVDTGPLTVGGDYNNQGSAASTSLMMGGTLTVGKNFNNTGNHATINVDTENAGTLNVVGNLNNSGDGASLSLNASTLNVGGDLANSGDGASVSLTNGSIGTIEIGRAHV